MTLVYTGKQSSFKGCVINPHGCVNGCLFNATELFYLLVASHSGQFTVSLYYNQLARLSVSLKTSFIQKPEGGFTLGPPWKKIPTYLLAFSFSNLISFSTSSFCTCSLTFSNCCLLKEFVLPCLTSCLVENFPTSLCSCHSARLWGSTQDAWFDPLSSNIKGAVTIRFETSHLSIILLFPFAFKMAMRVDKPQSKHDAIS